VSRQLRTLVLERVDWDGLAEKRINTD
jgi:hypothetical protein